MKQFSNKIVKKIVLLFQSSFKTYSKYKQIQPRETTHVMVILIIDKPERMKNTNTSHFRY